MVLMKAGPAVAGAVGLVVLTPFVLTGVGFTAAGVTAGSIAAGMMSSAAVANGGAVAAGSLVAVLQSVGAAGLSPGLTMAVAFAGGLLGSRVARFCRTPKLHSRLPALPHKSTKA
ncbi:interferon alpha-inducible protein 27, mitochondrial-like [Brachyhypopomus gauderio]|uniref:interferon alpha-inducible protein 27, mitochondrial-like n=1 Tax=Brachyhypopomus gauderio TaxID=698409 RepID=UPI004041302D